MKVTLTFDPDLATKAERIAATRHKVFKEVLNSALRIGLEQLLKPAPCKRYRPKPRPLGLRPWLSYDNISELLARAEGEHYR
jgi:hypothetical protein